MARPSTLILTADNKATNKNWTMLYYCEHLVRFQKMYVEVLLVFGVPCHCKNCVDQAHQGVHQELDWTELVYCLEQLAEICHKAGGRPRYRGKVLTQVLDFKAFFTHCGEEFRSFYFGNEEVTKVVKAPLVFRFTREGVYVAKSLREEDMSKSAGPFKLLHTDPGQTLDRLLPKPIESKQLSNLKNALQKIRPAYPNVNFSWLDSVVAGTWSELDVEQYETYPVVPLNTTYTPIGTTSLRRDRIIRPNEWVYYYDSWYLVLPMVWITRVFPGEAHFRGKVTQNNL